jgi:hypothetical protein
MSGEAVKPKLPDKARTSGYNGREGYFYVVEYGPIMGILKCLRQIPEMYC